MTTALISLLQETAILALLITSGLLPWWAVGRAAIPARERLPAHQLGWAGHLATLHRGATSPIWTPPHLRD